MTDINRTAITFSDGTHSQPHAENQFLNSVNPQGHPLNTSPGDLSQAGPLRLKVLIALPRPRESILLSDSLESMGCSVLIVRELGAAIRRLQEWMPELVITAEGLGPNQPDGGLQLAEYCLCTNDHFNGWAGTNALILVPTLDWNRFKRAQGTGAHVVLDGGHFGAIIRYVQTIADRVITDRMLGPALVGIHRYTGVHPDSSCEHCEWVGAEISYGSSKTDVQNLTAVRIMLLNALLFRRRGQRPLDIENACRDSSFLRRLLGKHRFSQSAVKMEATRLRQHLDMH